MKLVCLLALVLLALAPACAVEPADVSVYECLRCANPPTIDGRLDDACWSNLPVMDQFVKYWSPTPQAAPLKTAARLCFDDRGLYMGVTMYEEQLDKIRAEVTGRDNPETWHDDCVEIMFDPHNTGHSYFKFTTNINAARHDQKAANLVLDDGWGAEGWQVKTSRGDGAWFIEFFLPWADIDASARERDFWSFDLVRYGWATGGFKGVSWSLGGSGAAPAKFGYLHFGPLQPLTNGTLRRLAAVVRPVKGNRFRFIAGGQMLTHTPAGKWQRQDLQAWWSEAYKLTNSELTQAQAALLALPAGPDRQRLTEAFGKVALQMPDEVQGGAPPVQPADAALRHYDMLQLARQAAEIKWEAQVWGLVSAATK